MEIRDITEKDRDAYNAVVAHPLQSFEWGEFREKTGIKVVRRAFFDPPTGRGKIVRGFTFTIHKIPNTPLNIGYLPKGYMPDQELLNELQKVGKEEKCIFIQLEPNIARSKKQEARIKGLVQAAHPLFTKYTFILDLTKSEEELLKAMHPKARYNIRVAIKHGVEIIEESSKNAFDKYWRLMEETTRRQGFYAHTEKYHWLMWETLKAKNSNLKQLTTHLLTAKYKGKILTAWILFVFKDTLYYPYGASSNENREVMASNLIMWEAIRFGKKLGLKKFDMWGALGPNPDSKDPWFGFHTFKEKYGPEHIEFIGSFDLVINPLLYQGYKIADKLRWALLRIRK